MAKKQTRRSISLSGVDYEAARLEASRRGLSMAGLVEAALASIGVRMTAHRTLTPDQVRSNAASRARGAAARERLAMHPPRERQVLGAQLAEPYGF